MDHVLSSCIKHLFNLKLSLRKVKFWLVSEVVPSKHAGSDSEAFWLHPIVAISASVQPDSGWIWLPTSDLVLSFFPKKAWIISFKTNPDLIWIACRVLAKCIWSGSKPMYKNHQAQFWQNTTGLLPVSLFQTQLHSSTDCPDDIVQNQLGSDLVLTDYIRF